MADYHPLIARAVEGLGTSTGEARRGLYERARAALVSQLRGIDPPLSEADITRERLALEDAIRKVEAESVRKARQTATPLRPPIPPRPAAPAARPAPQPPVATSPRPERPAPPPRPETPRPAPPPPFRTPGALARDEARAAEPQSARSRLLNARTSPVSREGLRGFRDVVEEVDDLGAAS